MDPLVKIVEVGITALFAIAPTVAMAFTGGQTPEQAVKAARDASAKLPDRTDEADGDLADRLKRG